MPKYRSQEEIYEDRRWLIQTSGALNVDQALRWFDEDPDIKLDWFGVNDVYEKLGMLPCVYESKVGWLIKHGEEPKITINGLELKEFAEKYSNFKEGIVIKD